MQRLPFVKVIKNVVRLVMKRDLPVDDMKRAWVIQVAQWLGFVGLAGVFYPLLQYFSPSKEARAQGGPVRLDVSGMAVGEQKTVLWRGKPVWVVRRSPEAVEHLADLDAKLRDPYSEVAQQPVYAQNAMRSVRPDFLVLLGVCTHLGLSLIHI